MLLLYEYRKKKVVLRIMNLDLIKFSLLPCVLKHRIFCCYYIFPGFRFTFRYTTISLYSLKVLETTWKGMYQSTNNRKIRKEEKALTEKIKRSLDERHT
jgi:hypothetical protein